MIPVTAHAAFFKAGEAFNINMIKIPYNKKTYQVDLKKMESYISKNTVALVGSFPNFPHGICDDIEGLSKLALKYKLPLHVDACLGGFIACFYRYANISIPKFDFLLPGVTSMSADPHKYGLCPKGISLLMYRNKDYRKHQYFIYPHFMGGIYPSPSLLGSRSPATIAAAYATMVYIGKNKYTDQARQIYDAIKNVREYVKENLTELEMIGEPYVCMMAFTGKKSLQIFERMEKKNWGLNVINNPIGFSFCVTSSNLGPIADGTFLKDLQEVHDYAIENPTNKLGEYCQMYGLSLNVPEAIVRENMDVVTDCMLDTYA